MEASSYRKSFRDIVRGYSCSEFSEKAVYIRHLNPYDQIEIEEIEEEYYQSALSRGVPTREDMLELLEGEGDWTKEDERDIEEKQRFLDSLLDAKSKIILPSHIERQEKLIANARSSLESRLKIKEDLLGNTCEAYAKERTNDFYVMRSFYKDPGLKEPLFSEDEFDNLSALQVQVIIGIYNKTFISLGEEYIQKLVLQPFFNPYMSFSEDSMQFFGKPVCELTYCQVKLIVYAKLFKNIFENTPDIPKRIHDDPKALMDFASTSTEERDKIKEKFENSSGSTLVGATPEDYKELGLGSPGTVDLHEEAKKKGGSLSMQDLMKLSGVG